jgi:UDP-N-acetylglucosamine 2-epimerase (non-hydrolysing)
MELWFKSLNEVSEKYNDLEFILPIHPNPNVYKHKKILNKNIKVVDPLSHEELINVLLECRFVISDSGGIQEEATFLNKKTIVCRKTTERPEGINSGHLYLCPTPNLLNDYVYKINEDYYINNKCPYGDGHSSEKIVNILKNGNSNT